MKKSIIVAIDEKRGIGKNGDLLFRIFEDFKRMNIITRGHPLVMGRNTFESIKRRLGDGRTSIVITHDPEKVKRISFYSCGRTWLHSHRQECPATLSPSLKCAG